MNAPAGATTVTLSEPIERSCAAHRMPAATNTPPTNYQTNYYTNSVSPAPGYTPGPGQFNAGSVIMGGPAPSLQTGAGPALASTSPSPYQPVVPLSFDTFSYDTFSTFNPHIKQPYVESRSLGLQRRLSANNVLELRYVGNVSKDQWLIENFNEVNIFENGFLAQFQAAQANLAASGGTTFQEPNPTPIFDQAFATSGLAAGYTRCDQPCSLGCSFTKA